MYVLIVGGGKVGFHLARLLLAGHHEVAVLEQRPARAALLARSLGEAVVPGDGTRPSVLEAAGCARADVLAAVTGDDAVNFLVGTLGLRHFRAGRTVARLNDPRNERLFRLAGLEATVSSSALLAGLIEREAMSARVRTLLPLRAEGPAIVQVELAARSAAAGRPVREVPWPPGCLLVTVLRGPDALVATGGTELQAGDRLILLSPPEAEDALQGLLAPDPQ